MTYSCGMWSVRTPLLGNDASAIACSSASFCVAVSQTSTSAFNGSTWTEKRLPRPVDYFGTASISCPVEGSCIAINYSGLWTTYRNGVWSNPDWADTNYDYYDNATGARPGGISCPSMTFCAVVDANGTAVTLTGGKWSQPEAVGANLASVSCPTATFCAVLDSNGRALTWNGHSASSLTKIQAAPNRGVAVSCASPTHCVAIDRWGGAVTYNGSHWSAPVASGADFLHRLSCPTESFCLAYNDYDREFGQRRDCCALRLG